MASHPFLWGYNQGMVPWLGCPASPCDVYIAFPQPVPQFPHPHLECNDTDPCMKHWENAWGKVLETLYWNGNPIS